MIKFPKEIKKLIKMIEGRGFTAYAVGGCVRDSLLGRKPSDWDIATSARLPALTEIFPGAEIVGEKFGVIRVEAGQGEDLMFIDISTYRVDGGYSDFRRPDEVWFVDSVEEDLGRRDFTINAMAANPEKGLVDPFGGRRDIEEKQIRAVGDPLIRFGEDPLRMMRAIRFAAELGFTLEKETYAGIRKKGSLLRNVSIYKIRQEFEKIMVAEHAGNGLDMLIGTDLMPHIIGDLSRRLSRRSIQQLTVLMENIDKTKRIRERRLALFYLCFSRRQAYEAIANMKYDSKTAKRLHDALKHLDSLHFLATKPEFKKFLSLRGPECYEYLDGLSKAQRIVYDLPESKILSRHYMMREIRSKGDPIFLEDLNINGHDIVDNGIARGEKVGQILEALLDLTHKHPVYNSKAALLDCARQYARNPLLPMTLKLRRLRWRF